MNPADIANLFVSIISRQDIIAKVILLLLLIMYGLFAAVLANQIRILTKIFDETSFTPVIKTIAYVHIGVVGALILITIITL